MSVTFFRTHRKQLPNPIYGRQGQKPYWLTSKWHLLHSTSEVDVRKVNPDWARDPYAERQDYDTYYITVREMRSVSSCGLLVIPEADAQFSEEPPSRASQMCWGCYTVYRSGT